LFALLVVPLLVGLLAGYALEGRLSEFARNRIRAVWLLWLAAGLQLVHFRWNSGRLAVESHTGVSLMVPIFGLVGAWVLVNLPRRTLAIQVAAGAILLGGALNATVILANGRMPYSESAAPVAHILADRQAHAAPSPKHVDADEHTRLLWLGDIIPVAPIGMVISVGDVVLLVGVAGLTAAAMRGPGAGAGRSGFSPGARLRRSGRVQPNARRGRVPMSPHSPSSAVSASASGSTVAGTDREHDRRL
jgi:hypothetical protein